MKYEFGFKVFCKEHAVFGIADLYKEQYSRYLNARTTARMLAAEAFLYAKIFRIWKASEEEDNMQSLEETWSTTSRVCPAIFADDPRKIGRHFDAHFHATEYGKNI